MDSGKRLNVAAAICTRITAFLSLAATRRGGMEEPDAPCLAFTTEEMSGFSTIGDHYGGIGTRAFRSLFRENELDIGLFRYTSVGITG